MNMFFSVIGNETAVMRFDFGNSLIGTCEESLKGGNHFRYWTQNGAQANTCVPLTKIPVFVETHA